MDLYFVIPDGFNTSYIDSVLISLFYKLSSISDLLNEYTNDGKYIYLQELIKNNFISVIKKNFSVEKSAINEIRNYSMICGWKENMNITEQYNAIEYMAFILENFNSGGIQIDISRGDKLEYIKVNYLEIVPYCTTDINSEISNWISGKIDVDSKKLHYYKFRELPILVPIYINRNTEKNTNFNLVDINKRIRFEKKLDQSQKKSSWILHSIICYSNSNIGHYYTILNIQNQWYIVSNIKIPSITKIKISDVAISEKIKRECVIVLYRLENENFFL